jgi:hypothetical protein
MNNITTMQNAEPDRVWCQKPTYLNLFVTFRGICLIA